VQNNTSLPWS